LKEQIEQDKRPHDESYDLEIDNTTIRDLKNVAARLEILLEQRETDDNVSVERPHDEFSTGASIYTDFDWSIDDATIRAAKNVGSRLGLHYLEQAEIIDTDLKEQIEQDKRPHDESYDLEIDNTTIRALKNVAARLEILLEQRETADNVSVERPHDEFYDFYIDEATIRAVKKVAASVALDLQQADKTYSLYLDDATIRAVKRVAALNAKIKVPSEQTQDLDDEPSPIFLMDWIIDDATIKAVKKVAASLGLSKQSVNEVSLSLADSIAMVKGIVKRMVDSYYQERSIELDVLNLNSETIAIVKKLDRIIKA
jgi:hypothetical protein